MSSETVFEINGEKFDVVKRGYDQAKQVAGATQWLSKYGQPAFKMISENDLSAAGGLELAVVVLGALDANALVDLFQVTFGCTRKLSEECFDLMLLVDGLSSLYTNSPLIRKVADRFFSVKPLESIVEDTSTQSELPTGG